MKKNKNEVFMKSNSCRWKAMNIKLKSHFHLPKNESLLKTMKNAFYFILKAFFLLKIFKFLSCYYGHVEKTAWLGI